MSRSLRLGGEALALLRLASRLEPRAHLVGGAIRDAWLGRPTRDLDLAANGARNLARALAERLGGTFVPLDEAAAVYRVVLGPRHKTVRQIDVAAVQGRTLEEDLARRDFTINAIACPLGPTLAPLVPVGRLIDPRNGLRDLERGLLRAESAAPFREDPLRLLRAFRIAAQLDLEIEPKTLSLIRNERRLAARPAGERTQSELLALLSRPDAGAWLRRMDEARLLTAVLPELEPARRCALVYYGPGGVLKHSLDTADRLDFLLAHLPAVMPRQASSIAASLDRRPDSRAVLRLAALLHDVAKAPTARKVGGRLRFFGHDERGAEMAGKILKRLRFSRESSDAVATVIRHHLRPGNLAASGVVTNRAAYRFFRDLGDRALDLLLVCWADHASYLPPERLKASLKAARAEPTARGPARPTDAEKTVFHLQVVAYLCKRLFDRARKAVPDRLLSGHDVMRLLKIAPGPKVGELLEKVREAQAEGSVGDRKQALDFLRKLSP